MTKQSQLIIFILVIVACLFGYNYFAKPFSGAFNQQQPAVEDLVVQEQKPASQAEIALESLSETEKISYLLAVPLTLNPSFEDATTASTSSRIQWIAENNPGVVTLFGSNVSTKSAGTAVSLIKNNQKEPWLEPLVAVDHEGGTVQRLSGTGFSRLPSWKQLCDDNQVNAQIALEQSAEELVRVGVDIVFAPVIDVATSNPVLSSRVCSGDFNLVESRAKLAANTYYQKQILPVFKHFPGIGTVTTDLHTGFATVVVGEEQAQLYRNLLSFYQDRTIGIMISHAGVENQDPDVPCSLSSGCVGQLRNNFSNVLLFSDDLLMESVKFSPTTNGQTTAAEEVLLEELTLKAIIAGNDQVVIGPGVTDQDLTRIVENLAEAYRTNAFFKQAVDQRVLNVLEYRESRL